MASTFHERPIGGQYVLPGTHTAAGGTTNFNFGYQPTQRRCAIHYRKDLSNLSDIQSEPLDRVSPSGRCHLRQILTLSTKLRPLCGCATKCAGPGAGAAHGWRAP
jgi:hypothetical protein